MTDPCFALLDDCQASPDAPTSRLYTGLAKVHVCADGPAMDRCWPAVEADIQSGLHAVVLADYEWGAKLIGAGTAALGADDCGSLRVLLFRQLQRLDREAVSRHLADLADAAQPAPAGVRDWQPSVTQPVFEDRIAQVQALIRAGETYQVNFTYRLHGRAFGSPVDLYRRLRERQPVAFGALVRLPAGEGVDWVLSLSPELFVRHEAGQLTSRPMKGTVRRDVDDPVVDAEQARWLANDEKNRAENLMIVDLMRNDLGRVSQTGSVRVPALFAVEHHPTVHQMTSTVTSRIGPGVDFPTLLRALFPCGSITGTPKHHTMDLIARLEDGSGPRGLYTGAIGWLDAPPPGQRCGDFCLSVAIRTLTLGTADALGERPAVLGVGGGIVLDSAAAAEYEETRTKARFVTGMNPGFTLFETMSAQRGRAVRGLARHLARLAGSARVFGFRFDRDGAAAQLGLHVSQLQDDSLHRIRLDLQHSGHLLVTSSPLAPLPAGPVRLLLSGTPAPAGEAALRAHKTSARVVYDAAIQQAQAQGAFDMLFFNSQGELTEGARSNVFVRLDGRWCTPPLACGVLPGTARARLLARSRWFSERVIRREDLARAEGFFVCNALRGVVRAVLTDEGGRVC